MSSHPDEAGMVEFVAEVKDIVTAVFADWGGEMLSVFFVEYDTGQRSILPTGPWPGEGEERIEFLAALAMAFRNAGVTRVAFACEAWASEDPSVPPSQAADRKEIIDLVANERGEATRAGFYLITRADNSTASLGDFYPAEACDHWISCMLEDVPETAH
jgi:hypothetical protein